MPTKKKTSLTLTEVVDRLKSLANPENVAGMKRFGVGGQHTLGISIPVLRRMAREIGHDHRIAAGLWATGMHEARILASMVEDPSAVKEGQMDAWVADFDSWDVVDQTCMNLFEKMPQAWSKAIEWAHRESEFEKRAGFALMACLAWHDKKSPPARFEPFFRVIEERSDDGRNFVKKAASWALRNMGKRDTVLNVMAIQTALRIEKRGTRAARWVAGDTLKELTREAVKKRLPEA